MIWPSEVVYMAKRRLFLVKTILNDKISVCQLCKNKQLLTKHFTIQCHGKCKTSLNKEVILLLFILLGSLICNNELYLINLKGLDIVEIV